MQHFKRGADADMVFQVFVMTAPNGEKAAVKVLSAEDARVEVDALRAAEGCRCNLQLLLHKVSCDRLLPACSAC